MAIRHYPRLAEETRRLLTDRRMSLRQAEMKTGVGYSTIQYMKEGRRPRADVLLAWAKAFDEDPVRWLEMAGYEDIAALRTEAPEESYRERDAWADDPEVPEVLALYTGLPNGDREVVKALLQALAEKHTEEAPVAFRDRGGAVATLPPVADEEPSGHSRRRIAKGRISRPFRLSFHPNHRNCDAGYLRARDARAEILDAEFRTWY